MTYCICCVIIYSLLAQLGPVIIELTSAEEMFKCLLDFSPVHNVKETTAYPATMVTRGDLDDRLGPAHAFKFKTELQAKKSGPKSFLLHNFGVNDFKYELLIISLFPIPD